MNYRRIFVPVRWLSESEAKRGLRGIKSKVTDALCANRDYIWISQIGYKYRQNKIGYLIDNKYYG